MTSIDKNERQLIHIAGLEATLTKRNATIASLEEAVRLLEAGEVRSTKLNREYRRGWKDCANRMMGATQDAANALGRVRGNAFELVLEAEREATAEARAESER